MRLFKDHLHARLKEIDSQGLYKREQEIQSPQGGEIRVNNRKVLNFCSNNYLGLSNHPSLVEAAHRGLDQYGYGLSSVRFICGTQDIHRSLEKKISNFLGMEDTCLFSSCFDANGGVFEALLNKEDAIISDSLNHASIIDGIRLCKAQRYRYKNRNMSDLENKLKEAKNHRFRLIVTDGAFSMDGTIAPLKEICALGKKYQAMVMVDDSHCTGIMGENGRGTHEFFGLDGVDIITSTLGKALGGSSGGFVSASNEVIAMLRQKARPYLFSNTITPPVVMASLTAIDMVGDSSIGKQLRQRLWDNTKLFRTRIQEAGFTSKSGHHPVIPIMLGEARLSQVFAQDLLKMGIYVVGFFYPVVPQGEARVRVQISAAHTTDQIDRAVDAFTEVGKKHKVV